MANKTRRKRSLFRKPPAKPKQRKYTDEERLAAIATVEANGGNVNDTAVRLGIPYATLSCWVNGWRHPEARDYRLLKRGKMGDAFEEAAYLYLGIAQDKAHEAPFNHLMTGAGIAVDKMRLLRDEPTTINANEARDAALNTRLVELLKGLSLEQREQLESFLTVHAARNDDSGRVEGVGDDQGRRGAAELPPVLAGGVPDSGSLDAIQG